MVTNAIVGQSIGPKLIEVLGLPKETKWFEIRFAVDEAVVIKCCYNAPLDAEDNQSVFIETLKQYEFHEREQE